MTRTANDGMQSQRLEHIAAAQARRDRAKLVGAQAEITALAARIAMLEGSLSRRAGGPARRAMRLLRRLLKLPAKTDIAAAAQTSATGGPRGLALIIDHHWPQPDRDSGSIDIVNLAQALAALGFDTMLAASKDHHGDQPARNRLIAQGVRCLGETDAVDVGAFIRQHGAAIDLCVMCRVFCGGEFLERLQHHAPQARLVFNSIDLNYLREERRAVILQDDSLLAMLPQLREREEHLIRSSDGTLVVSTVEEDLLAETMPGSLIVRMPLARVLHTPTRGFSERSGIGFIGGFSHAPNVDAVRHFLADIWPQVRRALPDCEFSIVGSDTPDDIADGAQNVRVLGYQANIGPWFESLRLTIGPLRFGAGAKGKVASSLAHGVPCVVTSIAAEGMSLFEQEGVLIRDTATEFAEAVVKIYTDAAHWHKLSRAGLSFAEQKLSLAAWQAQLDRVLYVIGL